MKKIFFLLLLSVLLASCYESYVKDYDYNGVYFPWHTDVRTFVVGEGMKIEIGVYLAGVRENKKDRNVSFMIKNSLITADILKEMSVGEDYVKNSVSTVNTLLPLPPDYYTLSSYDKMIIKAGQHNGYIVMKADSVRFLADNLTKVPNYVISLYITEADADTIIEPKRSTVIGLKYENMLFGNYWHGGVTTVKDPAGNTLESIKYYTRVPVPEGEIWALTTVSPNSLAAYGYSENVTKKVQMILTLNGDNITISSATGADFEILPDGTSSFNRAKLLQDRKIILNYKYINATGNTCYAQDTLTFRNRIRDGVNEWQDENPSHYEK